MTLGLPVALLGSDGTLKKGEIGVGPLDSTGTGAEGWTLGVTAGSPLGASEGGGVGVPPGTSVGDAVGSSVGRLLGCSVGATVGNSVGAPVGASEGEALGRTDGAALGTRLGAHVGDSVGRRVGPKLGAELGVSVGWSVGSALGAVVGTEERLSVGTSVIGPGGNEGAGAGIVGRSLGTALGVRTGRKLGLLRLGVSKKGEFGVGAAEIAGTAVGNGVGGDGTPERSELGPVANGGELRHQRAGGTVGYHQLATLELAEAATFTDGGAGRLAGVGGRLRFGVESG